MQLFAQREPHNLLLRKTREQVGNDAVCGAVAKKINKKVRLRQRDRATTDAVQHASSLRVQ